MLFEGELGGEFLFNFTNDLLYPFRNGGGEELGFCSRTCSTGSPLRPRPLWLSHPSLPGGTPYVKKRWPPLPVFSFLFITCISFSAMALPVFRRPVSEQSEKGCGLFRKGRNILSCRERVGVYCRYFFEQFRIEAGLLKGLPQTEDNRGFAGYNSCSDYPVWRRHFLTSSRLPDRA